MVCKLICRDVSVPSCLYSAKRQLCKVDMSSRPVKRYLLLLLQSADIAIPSKVRLNLVSYDRIELR